MSRSLFFALIGSCFFLFLINCPIVADDSTSVDYDSTIKISAEVNKKEVPLNDSLLLKVTLTWTGDIKRYQISELEPPIVENFEIMAKAISKSLDSVGSRFIFGAESRLNSQDSSHQ